MKWFIPSWNGDLRLEPAKDPKTCVLTVVRPTAHEKTVLEEICKVAREKSWVEDENGKKDWLGRKKIPLNVSVEEAGPIVAKLMRPGAAVITAITFANGELVTHTGDKESLAALAKEAGEQGATAAATVKRPTPCCPACVAGAIEPASEVLLSFLTPEQHESWAKDRSFIAVGHLSGHRYLISHRHTKFAQQTGRMCYDLDSRAVVHFHDWSVPPEEEALAAKLIMEHREPWLRNEATMFHVYRGADVVFKNPFGDLMDGTTDAAITQAFGALY
jgi:hypothetical protein